jgi:hypothetical protein
VIGMISSYPKSERKSFQVSLRVVKSLEIHPCFVQKKSLSHTLFCITLVRPVICCTLCFDVQNGQIQRSERTHNGDLSHTKQVNISDLSFSLSLSRLHVFGTSHFSLQMAWGGGVNEMRSLFLLWVCFEFFVFVCSV